MAHDFPTTSTSQHPDYAETVTALKTVRDCVQGSWKIKRETYRYLPHPSQVETNSEEQRVRYLMYLQGAEFDAYPALSLRAWLGKMRIGNGTAELPDRISYLVQNADGDGTPLLSAIESAANNVFQTKYHVLVADYQGLSDVELTELSLADAQALNPRATIKQYTRESLVDWDYRRINGVMQLAYLKLREVGYDFNPETNTREEIEAFLILALDADGNYYQQKEVKGVEGERDYVTVNSSPLTWIPAEIVADEELPIGSLPQGMGMLYPICEKSLAMYINSADYSEARKTLVATLMTMGWKEGDLELFKQINGRDFVQLGGRCANNLPEGVSFDVLDSSPSMMGFTDYEDRTIRKVRQLGGAAKDAAEATRTATEADIDATEQNAMLETLASQLEYAWKRVISYCGMFEGLWQPDQVESSLEQINLELPRDFATPKMSVEEVKVLLDAKTEGLYTTEQVITLLEQGGWGTGEDIAVWLAKLEEAAPSLSDMANRLPREPDASE